MKLSPYRYSHLFDPEDFVQPYAEEPTMTSRDLVYDSWSESIDSVLTQFAEDPEDMDTHPTEFNWDAFLIQ